MTDNTSITKNIEFNDLYKRAYRLVAAVFAVCSVIDESDELKIKIKDLSLALISDSVNLKDMELPNANKFIGEVEKKSILLMSMLDIASITGSVSEMNGGILKEEFSAFLVELQKFSGQFKNEKENSIKSILSSNIDYYYNSDRKFNNQLQISDSVGTSTKTSQIALNSSKNGVNGHKRKDTRRTTILDFIKGHNNVSIKDIVPNIVGCSEKTIQRELISLIGEGLIKKEGERRWSRYSVV